MKRSTSFRLSDEARRILSEQAKVFGISQTAYLELLLRNRQAEIRSAHEVSIGGGLYVSVTPSPYPPKKQEKP